MITKRQADFAIKLIKDWENKLITAYTLKTSISEGDGALRIDELRAMREADNASTLATDYIYSLVDHMSNDL